MSEERLTELEIRLAYQEDTLQALNEIITRQQGDIDRLERMNRELYARLKEVSDLMREGRPAEAEKPPHY